MESVIIIFCMLLSNDAGLICKRRGLFQMFCSDFNCESCRIDLLNCVGLTKASFILDGYSFWATLTVIFSIIWTETPLKPFLFGVLAQSLLLQMPLNNRHHILVEGHGQIRWSDIDWDEFMRHETGKWLIFWFRENSLFCFLTLIWSILWFLVVLKSKFWWFACKSFNPSCW